MSETNPSYGVSIEKLMADYKTLLSYMKTIAHNPMQKTDAHLSAMARECLRELQEDFSTDEDSY